MLHVRSVKSMSDFQCLNCAKLGSCPNTDEEKLRTQYYCPKWEGASTELVHARNALIRNFGVAALQTLLKTEVKQKED